MGIQSGDKETDSAHIGQKASCIFPSPFPLSLRDCIAMLNLQKVESFHNRECQIVRGADA
jgi:hypothetical protein